MNLSMPRIGYGVDPNVKSHPNARTRNRQENTASWDVSLATSLDGRLLSSKLPQAIRQRVI